MPFVFITLFNSGQAFLSGSRSWAIKIFVIAGLFWVCNDSWAQVTPEVKLQQLTALPPDSAAPLLSEYLKHTKLPPELKCRALLLGAEINTTLSDFVLAEHYTMQALEIARTHAPAIKPLALSRLAKVYQAKNRYSEGQQLLQQALLLFEKNGNKEEANNTRIDLIEFYRAAADPYMAWRLYQDMKPDLMAGKLTPKQSARLLHRAAACAGEGRINDSLVALSLKSLAISTRYGYTDHIATSYNELGHHYRHLKKYELSLEYLRKAEKVLQETGNKQDQIIVLRNLVMLYTETGHLDEAEQVLAKLRDFPQRPALYRSTYDFALLESNLWKARGNFRKAYGALDTARRRQDETNWQMHNRQIDELTTKYRTALAEQRALEDSEAASDASKRALQHRVERNAAFIIGGLALLFMLLLGIAYRSNRNKKKQLEEQNENIDKINKLLSDSLHVQESLYNELHHRVKNNLSVLSSLLYLQSNKSEGVVKQALNQTQSRVEALAMLHRQLLGKGQILEQVGLRSYTESLFIHLQATFSHPGLDVEYSINCEEVHLPASIVTSVGLALNELITNSYKHAFAGKSAGEITLWCRTADGLLHVIYRDSGNGMADEKLQNTSGSLGLSIIHLLVRQHKGSFNYFREGGYSCFELVFIIKEAVEATVDEQVADYRR